MVFSYTRNEVMRAQTQINQFRAGAEVKIPTEAKFRDINKSAWIDQKRPFQIRKAEEKLISKRDHPKITNVARTYVCA